MNDGLAILDQAANQGPFADRKLFEYVDCRSHDLSPLARVLT